MKQKNNYIRAKNLVLQDKFPMDQQLFCKELTNFLSNRFQFDGLTVEIVGSEKCNVIICVNVSNVKNSRCL